MQRLLIIFICAISLASCVNDVEIKNRTSGNYLVLNAMLDDGEESHSVYLSYSDGAGFTLPEDAEVSMSVNGVSRTPGGHYDKGVVNVYTFDAALHPGDVVRIDARYNGEHAYAEAEVPQRAELVAVDTLRRSQGGESLFSSGNFVDFNLKIRDIPGGKNYYRLQLVRDCKFVAHFVDYMYYMSPHADSTFHEVARLSFDIGTDKILLDDYLPESSDNYDGGAYIFRLLNPYNVNRVFSDERFADGEAEVKFTVDSLDFRVSYRGIFINDFDKYYASYDADLYPQARVRLQSLSFDAYNYYRALNACDTFGFEVSPLIEPTAIPSNVSGGLGFVSVSSSSDAVIDFPSYAASAPGERPVPEPDGDD